MDASCREAWGRLALACRRAAFLLSCAVALTAPASALAGQALAHPVMHGKAYVGGAPLTQGLVVLHHLTPTHQGPVDSMRLGEGGLFTFRLPTVPDSAQGDLYFAAVEHDGVLYFGTPIVLPIQLDSLYVIHTYDTTTVATRGVQLPVQVRDVFVEKDSTGPGWRVTDLIEVMNQGERTLTARKDGVVWRYPLPSRGSAFAMGQTGFSLAAATFENDTVVVRAPIPPGSRVFVMRYRVPDPFISIPMPGVTSQAEMLIGEPAPSLGVSGLDPEQSVQLDNATYRRFVGQNLHDAVVTVKRVAAPHPPPIRWFAVLLALLLAGFGLKAFYGSRLASAKAAGGGRDRAEPPQSRDAVLLEIASLDESFESLEAPSEEQQAEYAARRAALLRRLRR